MITFDALDGGIAFEDPVERRRCVIRTGGGVDPDALDALFEGERDRTSGAHAVFTVWGLTVTVHDDGHILVHHER